MEVQMSRSKFFNGILGVILTSLLTAGITAYSQETEDTSRIKEGTAITIEKFDKKTKTFSVVIDQESAVGPNYATAESLLEALDLKKTQSSELKKKKFVLKKPLRLLSDEEVQKAGLN
jgi:hypothetical protein